jgi:hypothetical protein
MSAPSWSGGRGRRPSRPGRMARRAAQIRGINLLDGWSPRRGQTGVDLHGRLGEGSGKSAQLGYDLLRDQVNLIQVSQVEQLQIDPLDPGALAPGTEAISGLRG